MTADRRLSRSCSPQGAVANRPTYGELAKRITGMLELFPGTLHEERFGAVDGISRSDAVACPTVRL